MLLDCIHLEKSFGEHTILKDASFRLEEHEKTALVGANGCGKTTLLRMIDGALQPDAGSIVIPKNIRIGFLTQNPSLDSDATVYEEIISTRKDLIEAEESLRQLELDMKTAEGSALEERMRRYAQINETFEREEGYAYRSRVAGVLKGMGFSESDYKKKVSVLSGGEKTRLALGKLLLMPLDLLIMDEPTNHLDIAAIRWLEGYLLQYKGALLLVSHDRYFLNQLVSKVIEIENGALQVYKGNYDVYAEKKKAVLKAAVRAYNNQQREIEKQEKVIETLKSFNREKSVKRAESRQKMLDKVERLEKVEEDPAHMRIRFTPVCESGKNVLHVEHLSKSFQQESLFTGLSFDIYRGDKIALIGENGAGKTTLLRLLLGEEAADGGLVRFGTNVAIAYFDQEHAVLNREKTIFEEISDSYPHLTQTTIRNVMAAFLFTEDDVFSQIGTLSGGEQGRVALAKLMLSDANFLILDEPTNHLDIISKEILEEAIRNYEGTVLYISHDRYFINKTAQRIFYLNDKKLVQFMGNYDDFMEKVDDLSHHEITETETKPKGAKEAWRKSREENSTRKRIENRIAKIQLRLEEIGEQKTELEQQMQQEEIAVDYNRLNALGNQLKQLSLEEDSLYEEWETLSMNET